MKPKFEVADIFRQYGEQYKNTQENNRGQTTINFILFK